MEIKINDELTNDSKHVLSDGDIVTIIGKDRDLSDRYEVVTLKSDNGAFHMPKVNVPDKIQIPSVTIDFNKIKDSASEFLTKVKGVSKDDVKAKSDELVKAYQEKVNKATEALKREISKYVPTVLLVNLFTGETSNMNKLYAKLGGSEMTDLYMASVKKHVSFASALINGIGDLDGINDLGEETIRVVGRFEKEGHDKDDHVDGKEHKGDFDEFFNKLLGSDKAKNEKSEEKPEAKDEEKPTEKPDKKDEKSDDDDELDIKGFADLLRNIGAIGDNK